MLRTQIDRLRADEEQVIADAARRADQLLQKTMQQAKDLRRTAVSKPEERSAALREIQQLRDEARKQGNLRAGPRKAAAARQPAKATLEQGARVHVNSYDATGQVLELRGDEVLVQLGLLKVTVPAGDVRVLQPERQKQPRQPAGQSIGKTDSVVELNIRGARVEAGLEELRDFVQESHALRRGTIRILHGKGTGTLRDAVRRFLKDDRRIESFSDAPPYEGGHGVTIASLKV